MKENILFVFSKLTFFPRLFLVGYPPFSESTAGVPIERQIINGDFGFPDEFWSTVSDSVKDLIRKMMCINPVERFSIDQVLQHPWLNDDLENTERVQELLFGSKKRSVDDETKTIAYKRIRPTDSWLVYNWLFNSFNLTYFNVHGFEQIFPNWFVFMNKIGSTYIFFIYLRNVLSKQNLVSTFRLLKICSFAVAKVCFEKWLNRWRKPYFWVSNFQIFVDLEI